MQEQTSKPAPSGYAKNTPLTELKAAPMAEPESTDSLTEVTPPARGRWASAHSFDVAGGVVSVDRFVEKSFDQVARQLGMKPRRLR